VSGPSAPDSWLDRLQKSSFELLLAVIALVVAWQLLRQLLVPLVVIASLAFIIRLAVGWSRRDGW
jgi:hypothetical protein